jgi:hypothetical protein
MVTCERSLTRSTEWQLEYQGEPGQQPGTKALREHRPLELSSPLAARLQALVVGDARGTRLAGFVRELGFTLI